MSSQIQITGETKVKSLTGVLVGTSGVVSSLNIDGSLGIPQLDVNGKILVSQLPNSVMEYKGTWDASTNTPTLVNGTGNQGDVYLCNVAGTVNFGAGAIAFFVGDQVIYSGSIWQRASGATGTVTSVAVTESGDALTITGSPITTSGTINIGFAGTNLQYINGAGNLTTFPSLTGYVPYTGATANVDLGVYDLTADLITGARGSFASNGGSDTFAINHSSGGGIALNITKGGSGEGLYINKTSGSGNAATIVGTLEATTLVKTGGTSSQFLKADGTIDSSAYISLGSLSATSPIFYNSTTGVISSQAASATLEGYITTGTQTIAGLKTFSATLATNALIVSGQLTLYSTITNGSYTYTLPSATGTLALTSQIISISGTPNVIPRFNSAGTNIESGSILDYGTVIGTPPAGFVTVNARLTVNNYTEVNRYLSIIQNVDSSWALPSTGTSLEAFVTSLGGGILISDTAYLRPRKASDDTFKRFVIQGDDLILNDTTRRTLINKAGPTQSTTKLEVAGYTRFDAAVNINSVLYFNATDSITPTYLQAPSGNVTLLTTGTITLGTNSVSKFVFDVNGALNLGTSDNSNIININNQFSTLNSTLQGVHITPSILSASNSVLYTGVKSYPQFFLSTGGANAYITHYSAINANNTANTANQIGVYIDNLISVSGSYGIQSIINTATGSYNLYISGTAHNYLKGRLGVDQTNPLYAIDVTGDVNVTGNFKVNGTNLTQGVSGSGTQHYIPKFTSATSVGDSKIYQAPASGHLLVNTTYDYSGLGGYLQVAGGFTTESFANIIYGSAPYVGNTVTFSLVNGNTIKGIGDLTYFIENRINTGSTSATYYLNYWNGGTASTRYTLDHTGLHTFNNEVSISGATSIGGTLSGTSASFSSTATATAFIPSGATIPANGIYLSAANTLDFATNTTNRLTISSIGESTFSKKVQISAGGLRIGTSATENDRLIVVNGTNLTSGSTQYLEVIAPTYTGNITNLYGRLQYANCNDGAITNAYMLFLGSWSGTSTYSNKWSIYQESTTEKNYFGSTVLIGSATDNGLGKLQVTGAATFSGKISANTSNGIFSNFGGTSIGVTAGNYTGISLGYSENTAYTKTAIVQEQINDGAARGHLHFLVDTANDGNNAVLTDSKMMINGLTGNVGIGTSSPSYKLDVRGAYDAAGIISVRSTNTATIDVGGVLGFGGFHNGSSNESQWAWIKGAKENSNGNDNASYLAFATMVSGGSPTERMRITSGGNVLIGTTTDNGAKLNVNGAVYSSAFMSFGTTAEMYIGRGNSITGGFNSTDFAISNSQSSGRVVVTSNTGLNVGVVLNNGANSWSSYSDIRLKNINGNIKNALNDINTLSAIKYTLKNDTSNKQRVGLIAQEVEKILPEAIDIDEKGMLSVRYTDLIPMLIAAIKELKLEIHELKNK